MADRHYCPRCESEVRPFDKYCANCGLKAPRLVGDDVIVKCARCKGKGTIYRSIGDWSSGGETCPACGGSELQRV
jgi:predicted amidophosphoribosyltransferase